MWLLLFSFLLSDDLSPNSPEIFSLVSSSLLGAESAEFVEAGFCDVNVVVPGTGVVNVDVVVVATGGATKAAGELGLFPVAEGGVFSVDASGSTALIVDRAAMEFS